MINRPDHTIKVKKRCPKCNRKNTFAQNLFDSTPYKIKIDCRTCGYTVTINKLKKLTDY